MDATANPRWETYISLTFADLRPENRIPVCTRCTLPILLEVKDQLLHLGWSLTRSSERQCLEANTFLPSMLAWSASNARTDACQDSTQDPPNQHASGGAAESMLGLGALLRLLNQ
jgi:hypothetical protein